MTQHLFDFLLTGIECNGGVAEEEEVQTVLANETPADQEVPREAVLQEPAPGEFDFNEFFNLDKSVPGLASVSFFFKLSILIKKLQITTMSSYSFLLLKLLNVMCETTFWNFNFGVLGCYF